MDLYFLNFKRIIVPLNSKDMRDNILRIMEEQEIDVNIKFVNSYLEAAQLIIENKFDPYDHVVMSLGANNSKLSDFIEFLQPKVDANPQYVLEYTADQKLAFLE